MAKGLCSKLNGDRDMEGLVDGQDRMALRPLGCHDVMGKYLLDYDPPAAQ
jgi:hypothetical protein